ncbi:MAG: lipocalin family protein [Bacteroidales bacterium]|nr:lipocalin family protein [Bacteroidales bacterium]
MRSRSRIAVLAVALAAMAAGCTPKESHIEVRPSQLLGLWQRSNTQEYWRYTENATGVTWDEADDVHEDESNLTFSWTLDEDRLTHVFTGMEGNQAVPKVYTITAISNTSMRWRDDYSMEYSFTRVE